MTINEAFAKTLKTLRENKGISQEALALNCDLDRTFISLLERGLRQPSLSTIFKLAKELDTTATQFVERVEKQMTKSSRR